MKKRDLRVLWQGPLLVDINTWPRSYSGHPLSRASPLKPVQSCKSTLITEMQKYTELPYYYKRPLEFFQKIIKIIEKTWSKYTM